MKKCLIITGKAFGVIVVVLFILIMFLRSLPESYFILYPAIDTRYAAHYSEEKFDQIQIGMTRDEVLQMLGEPLIIDSTKNLHGMDLGFRYPEGTTAILSYTGDGACWFGDFAWLGRCIYLDQTGKVTAKNKSIHYN